MATWDPGQYLKFADHRLRPALDLMARIPPIAARTVYDLGCGPGNITQMLAERWPGVRVIGVDSSADMLARAKGQAPRTVCGSTVGWRLYGSRHGAAPSRSWSQASQKR